MFKLLLFPVCFRTLNLDSIPDIPFLFDTEEHREDPRRKLE